MGLLGCGRWGANILRDLRSLGCAVTVADPSEDARRRALEGGAAAAVPSAGDLAPVDGIVIATPTSTHGEAIGSVAHRGVPIFCEKPLTPSPAEAQRLARELGDRLFVLDKWRYHPGVEALRDLARSGELGPVAGLRTTRLGWGNTYADVDPVWILAAHDVSIGLEILGTIPAPRIATAERVGGAVVGVSGTLGTEPWMSIEVSAAHPAIRREVRLVCRDGVALLTDAYSDGIGILRAADGGRRAPSVERRPISTELPLLRELRACVAHVRGGPPPRSSAADGARIVTTLAEMLALAGG
jgi:predicted dehydrogenase